MSFDLLPFFQRAQNGHLVGIFEIATRRKAAGEASDAEVESLEALDEIHGRRFAFDSGISGDDDFSDFAFLDPFDELLDIELFRAGTFVRFDGAPEDMIEAVEFLGVLDDRDIDGFLDDADQGTVAFRIGTELAEVFFGDVEAVLADFGAFLEFGDGLGKKPIFRLGPPEQMEGIAGRCAGPHSRKFGKFLYEIFERFGLRHIFDLRI